MSATPDTGGGRPSPLDALIRFCLERKLVVLLATLLVVGWGLRVAPFDWELDWLPRDPVPVDAIPDLGENQQIVFTEWMGRSPQDIEDQVTYPLTVSLLGIPGVKSVRSFSFFGFSSVYVIFEESVDFYWSRSRVLEKLASLPSDALPEGVKPALGPDATALGQVFWYTLEGRDPDGLPAGGWDLDELRGVQDWYVRYALLAAEGVSEVASVGGFVREYQVDVDPDAMRAHGVTLDDVFSAVRMSNVDVGARTIEVNKVEYVVRGVGFLEDLDDIARTVVRVADDVPIRVGDVATVALGPALRRGVLDKAGAEAAGGVVVVRYGANPLAAIERVREKIEELSPGLPRRPVVDWPLTTPEEVARFATERGFDAFTGATGGDLADEEWLAWLQSTPRADWPVWITTSQVTVVPFYDRTGLIHETLGTLEEALTLEMLVTLLVVLVMVFHLRSSMLVGAVLPLAVVMCFIAMSLFGVDANIVALSGIAIAIGTMVDMGIVLSENVLRHLNASDGSERSVDVVHRASSEVGSAVLTAVATTVIGFLPVFAMTGAEGKLFRPLAFTKTFALLSSVVVALTVLPPAAHVLLARRCGAAGRIRWPMLAWALAGAVVWVTWSWAAGLALVTLGLWLAAEPVLPALLRRGASWMVNLAAIALVLLVLAGRWLPLGPEPGLATNTLFAGALIGGVLLVFWLFRLAYPSLLEWCLAHKLLYLCVPASLLVFGACVWIGFEDVFRWLPAANARLGGDEQFVLQRTFWRRGVEAFPGLGKEFMPPLDEGSFLLMPITMPHASLGEAHDVLRMQDAAIAAIPEVSQVVGKIGRVESPLDPAPISMVETVVNYYPEYLVDDAGRRRTFEFDEAAGEFARDDLGDLIPDDGGRPFRLWRDEIRTPDDIWDEIVAASVIPGSTVAPKLQPIATRLVMLQSGMRAPMGVKVFGPDLETIERVGLDIERLLKQVPEVEESAVIADRVLGKPYLEIDLDRDALARYGLHIRDVQDVIEVAIGGRRVTTTVEGRERYPVRVRYPRELRDRIDTLGRILVPAPGGAQIPLEQLAELRYTPGPQAIKSEDTFLTSYVIFDKRPDLAEVDVVEACQRHLLAAIDSGELVLPPGVSYRFAGTYENQLHAQRTLAVVLPLALALIFLVLYLQFSRVSTTAMVFAGILVAWSGGFVMLWLYGQPWFLDTTFRGVQLRELFQVNPVNLSVAIWVGFLALFGIASDDGVLIATYLDQSFARRNPATVAEVRAAVIAAARRRVRPALMTTATTVLALIPVLTSRGRGADIMVPMAIPTFGGMVFAILTVFLVPVLYCSVAELRLRMKGARGR